MVAQRPFRVEPDRSEATLRGSFGSSPTYVWSDITWVGGRPQCILQTPFEAFVAAGFGQCIDSALFVIDHASGSICQSSFHLA